MGAENHHWIRFPQSSPVMFYRRLQNAVTTQQWILRKTDIFSIIGVRRCCVPSASLLRSILCSKRQRMRPVIEYRADNKKGYMIETPRMDIVLLAEAGNLHKSSGRIWSTMLEKSVRRSALKRQRRWMWTTKSSWEQTIFLFLYFTPGGVRSS